MKKEAAVLWICVILAGCGEDEKPKAPAAPAAEKAAPVPAQASESPVANKPAPPASASPMGSARIVGTVRFEGRVPALGDIDMTGDPACHALHQQAVKSQALVLGSGNTLGWVLVRVKSGLPANPGFPVPARLSISQRGCMYQPHVFAVMAGQEIVFLNEEGQRHNVNAMAARKNRGFNLTLATSQKESEVKKFTNAELPFAIKCDVHPWMLGWCAVVEHPFFAVSGVDGRFEIAGLPAGEYEVEAWHEKCGTRGAHLTLKDGETGTLDFTFSAGPK